jgi:hypothetical protein
MRKSQNNQSVERATKLSGVSLALLLVLLNFQNCGSSDGQSAFGGASAPACSSSDCSNSSTGSLTLSFPNTTYNISSPSDQIQITGSCNKGVYASAKVEWLIKVNASTNAPGTADCVNGSFAISTNLSGYTNVGTLLKLDATAVGFNAAGVPTPGPKQTVDVSVGVGGTVSCTPATLNATTKSNLRDAVISAVEQSGIKSGNSVPNCAHGNNSIPNAVLRRLKMGPDSAKWGLLRITEGGITQNAGDRVGYFYGVGTAENAATCFVYFDFVDSCGGANTYNDNPSAQELGQDNSDGDMSNNKNWTLMGYVP